MVFVVIAIIALIVFVLIIVFGMRYVITSKKPEDIRIRDMHKVNELLELCKVESGEGAISQRIDSVLDSLKYGDVNSPDAARNIEYQILAKASELLENIKNKKSADVNSNLDEISKLIQQRDIITKNNR